MYAFCLQELTTIGGPSGTTTAVVQAADAFLDLSGFQDVVAWSDVKFVNAGGVTLQLLIETAPTQDEFLFEAAPLVTLSTAGSGSLLLAAGVQVNKALLSASSTPLARWVRWRALPLANPTAAWSLTFRIWICASTPGMR